MVIFIYPAILYKEDGYWLEFPDLVGAQAQGDTMEELEYNAKEALKGYLLDMFEGEEIIPQPSTIKSLSNLQANIVLIDVEVDKREYFLREKELSD